MAKFFPEKKKKKCKLILPKLVKRGTFFTKNLGPYIIDQLTRSTRNWTTWSFRLKIEDMYLLPLKSFSRYENYFL